MIIMMMLIFRRTNFCKAQQNYSDIVCLCSWLYGVEMGVPNARLVCQMGVCVCVCIREGVWSKSLVGKDRLECIQSVCACVCDVCVCVCVSLCMYV